jgi:tetratricopeptide (TPR) repeat protein
MIRRGWRLRDYFAALPAPQTVEKLDDLAPIIELYHHTVRAGQYDAACILFYVRINEPTLYQFGACPLHIELLRALFPDGEDRPPRLKGGRAQGWTLNALAISYSLSGQPRRAVPLLEASNAVNEKQGDKQNLVVGLANLATQQMDIGALRAAEGNLRHSIALCRESEDALSEASGHLGLGRLLARRSAWAEAEEALDTALARFEEERHTQGQGVTWAYRALRGLLLARAKTSKVLKTSEVYANAALAAARRALELADETARTMYPHPRDDVRAHWLLGAAHRAHDDLTEADRHLNEALARCRGINMVKMEADILLDLARLQAATGERGEALHLAEEARTLAARSGYVLQGADVHLFLARMALEEGDEGAALAHAREARRLAECDGAPDYTYRVAYDEAGALLAGLGAPDGQ